MSPISACDIMHPRLSIPEKAAGPEVIKKLLAEYPALPVVNENQEVVGIVSEYDILDAIKEGRTVHEFSAQSIMSCGHSDHTDVCTEPITVSKNAPIEEIVDVFFRQRISIIPVVDNKKLVGILSRKCIINSMAEEGFWKEHELQQRVKAAKGA